MILCNPNLSLQAPDDDILEFQRLMKEECGIEMTFDETRLRADELVALIRMLLFEPSSEEQVSDSPTTEAESPILTALKDLQASLGLIRPHSKDWVWPVRAAHNLLTTIFRCLIEASVAMRPSPTLPDSWRDATLPNLLVRIKEEGHTIPDGVEKTVDRLARLEHESKWITIDTWAVLGDQLPVLLRSALDLAGILTWAEGAPSTILSADAQTAAREQADAISDQLLVAMAKRT